MQCLHYLREGNPLGSPPNIHRQHNCQRSILSGMAHGEPIRKRAGSGTGAAGPLREIPDKLYFRIGEVARLCEVPAYVLRFWETEFPQLKPNKGGTGQRLYRRRDVEMALRVKTLLYDEGYTIPGARQAFKAELRHNREPQPGLLDAGGTLDPQHVTALRKDLRELLAMLSKPVTGKLVQPIRGPRAVAGTPVNQAELIPFARPALAFRKPPVTPPETGLFDGLDGVNLDQVDRDGVDLNDLVP